MDKSNVENELFKALDRLILIAASFSIPILCGAYFALPYAPFLQDSHRVFLGSVITNLVPVPLLFLLSYIAYRRIQIIRTRYETDVLALAVADQVKKSLNEEKGIAFLDDFPKSIDSDIQSATELWLIGVALSTPVKKYYSVLEQKLRDGHHIKILTVDPDSQAVEYAGMRAYARNISSQTKVEIQNSLTDFCTLRRIAPEKMSIRVINHPLGNGMVAINPDTQTGTLYIANYPFKTKAGSLPKFVLRPWDGRWYELYRQEIQNLWENAEEWDCDSCTREERA